jgi:predicted RNA-binding Zn-ribbon protein involved in translation (DUF1610 family)
MDEQKWEAVKAHIEEEMEKARRRAMVAESFDEMEEIIVEVGQRIQELMLGGVVEQRERGRGHRCPECGEWMRRKDQVPRQMKTSVGKVRFERERWVCPECGASLFPPGSADRA